MQRKFFLEDHRRILHDELTQVEKSSTTIDTIEVLPSQLAVGKRYHLVFIFNKQYYSFS